VSPLQQRITTTWTGACAHAEAAICCCLGRIKRGHVGVVVMLYDIGLMASLGDNMNLKTPLLSKPPQ